MRAIVWCVWGWVGAGVAIAWLAARGWGGYRAPRGRLLARPEMAFLEAAANALYPRGGAIAQSGTEVAVANYVDELVAAQRPRQRILMRALFVLFEHATLVFPAPWGVSRWRRFSSLSEAQQVAVLEAWRTSRLFARRLAFTSLRALLTLGYFAHPEVLRALHLSPYAIDAPVLETDLLFPRVGASRASIGLSPAELTPASDRVPPPLEVVPAPRGAGDRP